ncbi:MAG: hypothetical protein V1909_03570 [Candidatus Micrarchaeota archaeon]
MQPLRLSSALSQNEIIKKSKKLGFLPLKAGLAHSIEQFQLAHFLAKRSFKNKKNLAKIFELEFLLWLSGERDIRKALSKNDFSPQDFLLVSFRKTDKKSILRELEAKEKPLVLKERPTALDLERISLGRVF